MDGKKVNLSASHADEAIIKVTLSEVREHSQELKKITIILVKSLGKYQIEKYTKTQVFHENIDKEHLLERVTHYFNDEFLQLNIWTEDVHYHYMISKSGKVKLSKKTLENKMSEKLDNNRKKMYILEEGLKIEPLIDLGVLSSEGKIIQKQFDKFKQINRFVELIDDAISKYSESEIRIVDFGCGKSYLTFILYYYLTEVKGKIAHITGLDLKEDVIKRCNITAEKYGYKNLKFQVGDIKSFESSDKIDMVISLHACDVATDFAIYHAITWGAKMIFAIPCCQHELNGQMEVASGIMGRYGLIKERFCSLATDAIRGALLEYCGYHTQMLEFVDISHSPKNILIRAIKQESESSQTHKTKCLSEVEALKQMYHFKPKLYELLLGEK